MVGRCSHERRLMRSMGAITVTPLGSRRRDPEGLIMDTRVSVDVRLDVAAILQWVVIAAAMFLT